MGNSPTCIDCDRNVPKTVRFLDPIPWVNGRGVYEYFTDKRWIKIGNSYLCPDCLTKRNQRQRQEEIKKATESERRRKEAELEAQKLRDKQQIEKLRQHTENQENRRQNDKTDEWLRQCKSHRQKEVSKTVVVQRSSQNIPEFRYQPEVCNETKSSITEENVHKLSNTGEYVRKSSNTGEYVRKSSNSKENVRKSSVTEENVRKSSNTEAHVRKSSNTKANVRESSVTEENVRKSSVTEENVRKSSNTEAHVRKSSNTKENVRKSSVTEENVRKSSNTEEHVRKSSCTKENDRKSSNTEDSVTEEDFYHVECLPLQNYKITLSEMSIDSQKSQIETYLTSLYGCCVAKQDCPVDFRKIIRKELKLSHIHVNIAVYALSHIHCEIMSSTESSQTYEAYLNRQKHYSDIPISQVTLLRKYCDALVVLSNLEENGEEKSIIESVLHDFVFILLDTLSSEYLRNSIRYTRYELQWGLDDLLILIWFLLCNKEKGSKIMHLICSYRLDANDIVHILSKTSKPSFFNDKCNEVMQKVELICRNESFRDISQILKEMGDSEILTGDMSNDINDLLSKVVKKLKSFGYPNDLPMIKKFTRIRFEKWHHDLCQQILDICLIVKKIKGFWPKFTQLVSLCLMIKKIGIGCLLQMNTGEGKTCTIAMLAVYLAKSGKYVDIVSSSPILAERDCKEWKDFYDEFNINVCSNLVQNNTEERFKCYQNTVVYGTVESFASDILRQEFLMEDVRSQRKFDAVIVDEVDCMLLDNGVNFVYLSNEAPGMHHLEPILFMIWNEVIRHPPIRSKDNKNFYIGKHEPFHILLSKMIHILDAPDQTMPLDVLNLLNGAGVSDGFSGNEQCFRKHFTKERLFKCLLWIESKFDIYFDIYEFDEFAIQMLKPSTLDNEENKYEILIVGEGLICLLHQNRDELCKLIESKIKAFLTTKGETCDEPVYVLPSYLLKFAVNRLPVWIGNAFLATNMTPGREYLVKDKEIVPVDYESTGVIELNTKWGDGLHQFLEMKHKLKISSMTIVTNFMSTNAFFGRYPGVIYGISGTLGSVSELAYLYKTFGLKSANIPTCYRKKNCEIPAVVCEDENELDSKVQGIVEEQITPTPYRGKRAVLVICIDINTAEHRKQSLNHLKYKSLQLYTKNEEESSKTILHGGDIIVATNIAGRGTDIEIDESVASAGGLFVLVTFLPLNTRVEEQVFGRCARKGQPGSSQIILNKQSLPFYLKNCESIEQIKAIRNDIEARRIKEIERKLLTDTNKKEALFLFYCQYIHKSKVFASKNKTENQVQLGFMHEYWGLWLKMKDEDLDRDPSSMLKYELEAALGNAVSKIEKGLSPCANPYHTTKFANEELLNGRYDQAFTLYSRSIEMEKDFAAIAYYNRAYCIVLQGKEGYIEKAILDLEKSKMCFCHFKNEAMLSLSQIGIITCKNDDESEIKSQFYSRLRILALFDENIEECIKTLTEIKNTKCDVNVSGSCLFNIALGDSTHCKKIDRELQVFWELGLTEVVRFENRPGFCWQACLVAFVGVLQIAVGTVIIASTSGMLTNVGWGLVTEGINDICTGVYALVKGDNHFIKSWAAVKAINITISIATTGFTQLKTAVKGTKGLKATFSAAKAEITSGAKNLILNAKAIPKLISKSTFKQTCKVVAQKTGKELTKRTVNCFLDLTSETIQDFFAAEMKGKVSKEVKLVVTKKKFKTTIAKFTTVLTKQNKSLDDTVDCFMKITNGLLTSNKLRQLRQILISCVHELMSDTKATMQKETPGLSPTTQSIFKMIAAVECGSFDVKKLVTEYSEHVCKAICEIHATEFELLSEEEIEDQLTNYDNLAMKLETKISNRLCAMIQDMFDSNWDSIVSEKLKTAVHDVANNFAEEHGINNETLKYLFNISEKGLQLKQSIKENNQSKSICSGLDITKDCISLVCEDNDKREKLNFFVEAAKVGAECVNKNTAEQWHEGTCGIAKEFIDTFIDDGKMKSKLKFAVNTIKSGIDTISSDDFDKKKNNVSNVLNEAVDVFVDDENTRSKLKFTFNATKCGIDAVTSDDFDKTKNNILCVANEGVDAFVDDENTRSKLKFTFNATKCGIDAVTSDDFDKTKNNVLCVANEGVDVFVDDEDIRSKLKFTFNATKCGIDAVTSDDFDKTKNNVLCVANEGVDVFVDDEDIRSKLKFTFNATKCGIDAVTSDDFEKTKNNVLCVANEGVDVFVGDEDIRSKLKFIFNAAKCGIDAVTSDDFDKTKNNVLCVANEGVDVFVGDEDIRSKLKFTFKATKCGIDAVTSDDFDKTKNNVLCVANEGVDVFVDDENI